MPYKVHTADSFESAGGKFQVRFADGQRIKRDVARTDNEVLAREIAWFLNHLGSNPADAVAAFRRSYETEMHSKGRGFY